MLSGAAVGCAQGSTVDDDDVQGAALTDDALVSSRVIVADTRAAAAAIVEDDAVRIPLADAARFRGAAPGALVASARGPSGSENPDGFLRSVVSVAEEGGMLVLHTEKASITDAIVRGDLRTGPFGVQIDDHGSEGTSLSPSVGRSNIPAIQLDLAGQTLFENVDEVQGTHGTVHVKETIHVDQGRVVSQPDVDVDLRIRDGKVARFAAKVEGSLDAEMLTTARVELDGPVDDAVLAELRAKKHHVRKVLHTSRRIPLPTISVGRVPVSPSVQIQVALVCDLAFGGAHVARAGVQARSSVKLTATYENGAWLPPSASTFAIRPTFQVAQAGEVDARCALESSAELSAYGVGGVTMTVAPWVSYDVARQGDGWTYKAEAGATGAMRGSADVFGVKPEDLERTLIDWSAGAPLAGTL